MPARSPLAYWLLDQLDARGEKPEQFAVRIGINPSGFHKLLRGEYKEVRNANLEKIASGLGMSSADIVSAVDKLSAGGKRSRDGEFERDLQARGEWFVSMLRGIPRPFWGSVLAATTAVARALPPSMPVSDADTNPVSESARLDNGADTVPGHHLPSAYHVHLPNVLELVTGFTSVTSSVR